MTRTEGSSTALAKCRWLFVLATAALLTACGGSSGGDSGSASPPSGGSGTTVCNPSDPSTSAECGTLLVSITDAEGDIVSYGVDVLSLSLRRANGSTVETLPAATRVDLAQLTELSELLSSATLIPGEYTGGTIQIDYTNAEVFVEAGDAIVAADILDADGEPLGVTSVEMEFADDSHLFVTRGSVAFLSLDVDLAVSHDVNTDIFPPLVTAEPLVVAEIAPVDEKELRVRGPLVSVDLLENSYDIRLRPWQRRDGDHGTVTVNTTTATSYEIGDMMYTGTPGLEAMADLDAGTMTVAFGTLDLATRTFTASIVHARDSVGGDGIDAVHGNIVARSGDLLTVKGAFSVSRNDRSRFHRTVFVEVGPNTTVFKRGDRDTTLTADSLSVGQRIVAFGQFEDPSLDDPANVDIAPILDATAGRVRMIATNLHGTVTSVAPGELIMQLRGIDRLGIDMFQFEGTGPTPADDADPTAYQVSTQGLPLDAVEPDKWARVVGFVTPFGSAPPDFAGHVVIGHRDLRAVLGIGWGVNGTAEPFETMSNEGLLLDLENEQIGVRHHMLIGRRLVDLFNLDATPFVSPSTERSLFTLGEPGHVELFRNFPDFLAELEMRLDAGDTARSMAAWGIFDEVADDLTARSIVVFTIPAE